MLEQFQSDELLLDVKRPGEAIVKVRWTPYWFASNACVEPYGDWTEGDRRGGRLRPHVDAVRARAAGLARPPLRRRGCEASSYARRPCRPPTRSWSSWLGSGA